jgi:hypothetical protein
LSQARICLSGPGAGPSKLGPYLQHLQEGFDPARPAAVVPSRGLLTAARGARWSRTPEAGAPRRAMERLLGLGMMPLVHDHRCLEILRPEIAQRAHIDRPAPISSPR